MKTGDSRTKAGPGILPLQAHNRKWSVGKRPAVLAYRLVDRKDGQDQLGHWVYDESTKGDLICSFTWPVIDVQMRDGFTSGWSFAWPVVVARTGGISTGGKCSIGAGGLPLLPIYDAADTPDLRFKPFIHAPTAGMGFKLPVGGRGIMLAGTNEYDQENLFFPCDNRLVAPNRYGNEELGTPVFDVSDKGGYDTDHAARLQSFWRVILPLGGPPAYKKPVLAWQIGPAGCEDDQDGWGFMYGLPGAPIRGNPPEPKKNRVIGVVNESHSGPFDLGSTNDAHHVAGDRDGEPINSLHLATNAYFRGLVGDGPLNFDPTPWVEPQRAPVLVPVHLRWNPGLKHDHITGQKDGKWDWVAESFLYVPTPCETPKRVTPGTPGPPAEPPAVEPPFPPVVEPVGPIVIPDSTQTDVEGKPLGNDLGYIPVPQYVRPYTADRGYRPIAATTIETAFPSILFRPQSVTKKELDLRNWLTPSGKQLCRVDSKTPVTLRVEAFGNEPGGGTVADDKGSSRTESAAAWGYRDLPGDGRFPAGTSVGGVAFLPPETDMSNYANDFAVRTGGGAYGSLRPEWIVAIATNVYLGFGIPDPRYGTIREGYTLGDDTSVANVGLRFRRHNLSGTTVTITDVGVLNMSGFLGIATNVPTSHIESGGSFGLFLSAQAQDITLSAAHCLITEDASGAARTVTLPAANTCAGRVYHIKKIDSGVNAVTITPAGADTIEGAASVALALQYASRTIFSNGSSVWYILAST